jgi:hypothetical protein
MFDYYREDGELLVMCSNECASFWMGSLLGGALVALLAGFFISDVTTPAEYASAVKVCESNGGLEKIGSYVESQKVFCINGASFTQNFEKIEMEAR